MSVSAEDRARRAVCRAEWRGRVVLRRARLLAFQVMAGERPAAAGDDDRPGAMKEGRITHLGQQVCWVWQELAVPVIAAVHGHALGGGCSSRSVPTSASSTPTHR